MTRLEHLQFRNGDGNLLNKFNVCKMLIPQNRETINNLQFLFCADTNTEEWTMRKSLRFQLGLREINDAQIVEKYL